MLTHTDENFIFLIFLMITAFFKTSLVEIHEFTEKKTKNMTRLNQITKSTPLEEQNYKGEEKYHDLCIDKTRKANL